MGHEKQEYYERGAIQQKGLIKLQQRQIRYRKL